MTVAAVLLVPAEGDPHGLLREGPCEARPPRAEGFLRCKRHGGGWVRANLDTDRGVAKCERCRYAPALVLAWEDEVVVEGCFRLDPDGWLGLTLNLRMVLTGRSTMQCNRGTLVLLDAEGREVSP